MAAGVLGFYDPDTDRLYVVDDATKRLLYAQLWPAETTVAVLTALRTVFARHGLPVALYTDRAGWAFHTPQAGGRVDRTRLTQVGRALAELGIEHIASYCPQGRGRSERVNRTVQGRLINELALAGITTVEAANGYLIERFLPDYDAEFAHPPADPTPAFVPLHGVDLDAILCHLEERTIGRDNVVVLNDVPLQVPKQPGRRSCAGVRVTVRRDVHGEHSVWHGTRCWGRFDVGGRPLARPNPARAQRPPDRRALRGLSLPRPGSRPTTKRRGSPRLPIGPGA